MNRVAAALTTAVLALLGAAAPVTSAHADVEDFEFASFHADYHLGTDEEGHSTLRVVETIVAVFPDFDQNRGIIRTIPDRYDGHPINLEIASVTDETGEPVEYEEDSGDDSVELALGGDDYVHGEQTYVIEYTAEHVTRHYADTEADEFYWDVNGTEWAQPFREVSATVHLEEGLEEQLTGNVTAVWGFENEQNPAEVDGLTFTATDLEPGQTLSFAIGFEPGTFVPRESGYFASPWPTLSLLGALAALAALAWAATVRRRHLRDEPGRPTIIAEYAPPKDANLLTSALLAGVSAKTVPAQVIDFAVRGKLRVLEEGEKPLLGSQKYTLEFVTAEGTDEQEREFLNALFGDRLTRGERRTLGTTDSKAAKRLGELTQRVTKDATARGYRKPYPAASAVPAMVLAGAGALAALVFGIIALEEAYGWPWPLVQLIVGGAAAVVAVILLARVPLTARGAEVRDHMKGLDEYITLAEADRIRYLQSPEGALREPVATDDPAQLVRLGERLLPYAMLFGHEKEWAEELGRLYEQAGEQPGWYVGMAPFNAAIFANSIGSVGTSSASTFSSSSGGSTGGAVAGGGGGGGGGGGR
ncbi:DUF2207 domain-containing protein [Salinibacterium sp. SYSU T00001]|uniref:DUF2207 domain-containing protein n=1 Tax=Homoserinimonas sedimenticola TaxID=2986805 RepID=UPI002235A201|nr:DUF2207 domain-containing protein [Salinibacterium sedimenticola]MCW4386199.1 DUF2207 domain-containing protein [Salinibacterium sedimenticola]